MNALSNKLIIAIFLLLIGLQIAFAAENAISPEEILVINKASVENLNKDYGTIIEFEDEPLVRKTKRFSQSKYDSTLNKHDQIKARITESINEQYANTAKNHKESYGKIKREYIRAFNGISIDMPYEEAKELLSGIEGIKNIVPDYEIKALLMDSAPQISAEKVWELEDANGLKLTGKGIKIAVIDTGVDYTHPDLGGCSKTDDINNGSCKKVIGGYDFVNDDTDPLDDNGHGTHVSGIASGKGLFTIIGDGRPIRGIAPDANVLAYKVLDSVGSGDRSDIIAGIERAMDPNQDGDFSDHADVMVLSLGTECLTGYSIFCGPDDPVSRAVDNAVDAGVVVSIAAGNSGPDLSTISSPGTARKAITVGAVSKSDEIADFSSRGLVVYNGEIILKPDVVAPGVDILAPYDYIPETGQIIFATASGTSMAAPHVAGAAALILQRNPELTPEEIKSKLKDTALDIGEDINAQGTGRIDVFNAIVDSGIDLEALNITHKPLNPQIGERVKFNFTIRNNGPDDVSEYTVSSRFFEEDDLITEIIEDERLLAGYTRDFIRYHAYTEPGEYEARLGVVLYPNDNGQDTVPNNGISKIIRVTPRKPACGNYGDVNEDGFVTKDDAILISNHIVGNIILTEEQIKMADVNFDSNIDIKDSLLIVQYADLVKDTFPICSVAPSCIELLTKVKASYGLMCGQEGYDYVADVNEDEIVDALDFGTVVSKKEDENWCSETLNRDAFACEDKITDIAIVNVVQKNINGTNITFDVTIKNSGEKLVSEYGFSYHYGDGTGDNYTRITHLEPGELINIHLSRIYWPGAYTATFEVTTDNDNDPSNNIAAEDVFAYNPIILPDLVVSGMQLDERTYNTRFGKRTYTYLKFKVKNIGNADVARSFNYRVEINGKRYTERKFYGYSLPLKQNQERTVPVYIHPRRLGNEYKVTLDSRNSIEESNEDNNYFRVFTNSISKNSNKRYKR
jgi:subtilisin family serine protease